MSYNTGTLFFANETLLSPVSQPVAVPDSIEEAWKDEVNKKQVQRQQVELDSARTQRIQEASLEERMGTLESRIDEKLVQMEEMMEKTLSSVETLQYQGRQPLPKLAPQEPRQHVWSASQLVSTAQSLFSSDADELIRLALASSLHIWEFKQMGT
ncbi:hypothetical protein AAP_05344 [Ascosphaera apis ARSEF 7405]|uniref:Uncharacterized protein n=1 Tax=Ascosphaera apis ARSEF 7405 TaxID=392613 RepID=A0A166N5R8_9EURO|nr:hypothetical protein AAP_05344 [Ascosphaera apis ARSEF 7405]